MIAHRRPDLETCCAPKTTVGVRDITDARACALLAVRHASWYACKMICVLDTEFTDLIEPELLSVGMITLDGREHYVELDMSPRSVRRACRHRATSCATTES